MARIRRRPLLAAGLALALGLGTVATAPAPADASTAGREAWVRQTLRAMTLEQKVGQLFVPYADGATATTPSARATAENLRRFGVKTPAEAVQKLHLGGIIYFAWADNVANPTQIAELSNGLQEAALGATCRSAPSG